MVTSSGSPSEMVAETSPESDHAILLPSASPGSRTPSPQILDWHSHPWDSGSCPPLQLKAACCPPLPSLFQSHWTLLHPWSTPCFSIPDLCTPCSWSLAQFSVPLLQEAFPVPRGQVRCLLWRPTALYHLRLPISYGTDCDYSSVSPWDFVRAGDMLFCLRLKVPGLDTY